MKPFLPALIGAAVACLLAGAACADPPAKRPVAGAAGAEPPAKPPLAGAAGAQPPAKPPLAGAAGAQPPAKRPDSNSLGAGWRQQQDEARQGVRQRRLVPLETVIDQIRRQTPGRQLDAGLEYDGDRAIYRVRWMTADGRRVDYMIDAATGAVLSGK